LVLLAYGLTEDLYLNLARFLSQLLFGLHEILVIGMQGVKKGYSKAGGCAQPTASRDISSGVKFYPLLDADKARVLPGRYGVQCQPHCL